MEYVKDMFVVVKNQQYVDKINLTTTNMIGNIIFKTMPNEVKQVTVLSDTGRVGCKAPGIFGIGSDTTFYDKEDLSPFFLQLWDVIEIQLSGRTNTWKIKNIFYERGELLVQNVHNDILTARYIEMSLLYFHSYLD